MKINVTNANFKFLQSSQVSDEVKTIMTRYTGTNANSVAAQTFYDTIGATLLAKCSIIVPCMASTIKEATADFLTGTDLRSSTWDDSYNVLNTNGLVANDTTGYTTGVRKLTSVETVSDPTNVFRLFASSVETAETAGMFGSGGNGGYIWSSKGAIWVGADYVEGIKGLSDYGFTINSSSTSISVIPTSPRVIGVYNTIASGGTYAVLDGTKTYSVNRTTAGKDIYMFNALNQGYNTMGNCDSPISVAVIAHDITLSEAETIRDAVKQFMTKIGLFS